MTNDALTTGDGKSVRIEVNTFLQWVLGICAVLITGMITWGTTEIVSLDNRVSVIESSRFTAEDWISASNDHVTFREYDAAMLAIQTSLSRIEDKLDTRAP